MVRLFIEPPKADADNAVNNWVANFNEWTEDPVEHTLIETNTETDGSGTTYIRGDYRFHQDSGKTALLDDLESKLQSIQGGLWYRVGYHVCDHDESESTARSWEDMRENGTVPEDVPTFI